LVTPPASADRQHRAGSLTEWLRDRTDEQLSDLLRLRPDLALPAPTDLAMLASRLSVRTSVQRAVDGLDELHLRTLEALVVAGGGESPLPVAAALALLPGLDASDVEHAVDGLRTLGLVWGGPDVVHLVATVRDAVGAYPAGLGRPAAVLLRHVSDVQLAPVLRALGQTPATQPRAGAAVAEVLADRTRLDGLIAQADAAEREVLDRLAAGPPVGSVRNAHLPATWPASEQMPAPHRLMLRGLLVPIDAQTVELPREVAFALRAMPLGAVAATPPPIDVVDHEPAELDRMGTTAVLDVLRLVDALAGSWAAQPPALLRAGGVGVRDLRRTARDLGVAEPTAALVIETAHTAGLIAPSTGIEPVYLPTTEYDTWRAHDPAQRWTDLAAAWLAMSRQPSLVSQRGDRDRLITVLGPDVERGTIAALRTRVLGVLMTLPPGGSPARRSDVLARLSWEAPRRAGTQRPLAEALLAEADVLGITAAGGLTGYMRTLLDGSRAAARQALANALPQPVDHFLVQPDLTVVVPGPPTPDLANELALAADLESTGGASVYRITETSIRRALDAGRSGADLTALVTERSRTPVPQALSYLIDDVSRRHGVLRAGTASAYLRCDDDALLSRVLADRDVQGAQLRRLAPSVAIATAPINRVLDVLRQAGYAPAAEAPDGAVITLGADAPRATSRAAVRVIRPRSSLESAAQLSELVRRIRAGDSLTELSRRVQPIVQQVPGVTSATTMALLRQAIREGRHVLLGHADPDGTASRHTILPISLAGGFVRGHESATQRLQSFPLHRLTAVSIVADDGEVDEDSDDPA